MAEANPDPTRTHRRRRSKLRWKSAVSKIQQSSAPSPILEEDETAITYVDFYEKLEAVSDRPDYINSLAQELSPGAIRASAINQPAKLVFLDVDGVLNSASNRDEDFNYHLMRRLKYVLTQTNAQIVISSFLRTEDTGMKQILSACDAIGIDVQQKIVGSTLDIHEFMFGQTPNRANPITNSMVIKVEEGAAYDVRVDEIHHWIDQATEMGVAIGSWAAVDDRELGLSEYMANHFVQTVIADGLSDEKANELVQMLG